MTTNPFAHYRQHLEALSRMLDPILERHHYDTLVVHSGAPMYRFLDDLEYPFKVNPHFAWWVPVNVPNSVVEYRRGQKPRLFYFQPVDYWHIPPAAPDPAWADAFELHLIREAGDWREQVKDGLNRAVLGDAPRLAVHFTQAAINPTALIHEIDLCRARKTQYEQDCLARANQLAARAHRAAALAFDQGASEFETHLAYMAACSHAEHELPYGNIIAQNSHGGVLHYHGLERENPAKSLSFLIDAGASFHGYAADITRTYAAEESGIFPDLIAAMDKVQLALVDGARQGVDYRQLHIEAHQRIARVLRDAGIVRMSADDMVESRVSSAFFPHGLGHFLGLQVHDVGGLLDDRVGERIDRPEGHPYLRLTRKLAAGNVVTIEPGLYFIPQLLDPLRANSRWDDVIDWDLVDQLLPYGGIRIEDDVVIQPEGPPLNLSRRAFAALENL